VNNNHPLRILVALVIGYSLPGQRCVSSELASIEFVTRSRELSESRHCLLPLQEYYPLAVHLARSLVADSVVVNLTVADLHEIHAELQQLQVRYGPVIKSYLLRSRAVAHEERDCLPFGRYANQISKQPVPAITFYTHSFQA
jgi:hypothetical protein